MEEKNELKIPLFDLNYDEQEAQVTYDVIKSGWISTGAKCLKLEENCSIGYQMRIVLTSVGLNIEYIY